jgi:hypothetical protein
MIFRAFGIDPALGLTVSLLEENHSVMMLVSLFPSKLKIFRRPAFVSRLIAFASRGFKSQIASSWSWLAASRVLGKRTDAVLRPQGRPGFTFQNF